MTLIFKSDVAYTGVVQATNILELLTTASEKTTFINKILNEIGEENDYVTDATSANIIDRLLTHTKRMARIGAQVLSIPRTLKAILFAMEHELLDTDYAAFSPDFGVRLDANGNMRAMYCLGIPKEMSLNSGDALIVKKTKLGYNSLSSAFEESSSVVHSALYMTPTKGLIIGQCIEQGVARAETPMTLRLSSAISTTISANVSYRPVANIGTVILTIPTTSASTDKYSKTVTVGGPDSYNNSGLVAKYEYGTANNKLFMNGDVLINDSETETMFDLSTTSLSLNYLLDALAQTKIIETWVINSKSDSVANALSIHLDRR